MALMIPTVVLFDIDGTLIVGGAGRRALLHAFVELHGEGSWLDFELSGRTDRAIVAHALERQGKTAHPDAVDAVLEGYLARLPQEVETATDYAVLPGVVELIEQLRTLDGCATGLGTGNIRAGARVKLARGGLERHFAFGGFGCDAERRDELLRIGAERGAARLGRPRQRCRVVIVGDTPRDVEAGLAIGAECIGVGTGRYDCDALLAAGAHVAFADLCSEGAREAVLGGAG